LRNHYCREKTIIIKHSQCVAVALVIQHAKPMCRIILSAVICLAVSVPGLPILSFKPQDYLKNIIDHKMCVWSFSTNLVINIFHYENSLKYYHTCKYVFI
jgi:hypothetical protein